jgi:hypothetical protein
MYKWFIRWLNDGKGDFHERPVTIYPNHELLVTKTGRVDDEPGSRKLHELIGESLRAKRKSGTVSELAAELRRLGIRTDGSAPLVQVLGESEGDGFRTQKIRFTSEPGIAIEGSLLIPHGVGRKPAVLLLGGRVSDLVAESMAKAGRVVLKMDPRRSVQYDDRRPYVGDWLANTRADLIGLSLAALRARDILRGVDLLAARSDVDASSIRAAAQGVKGIWLLLASAADSRIQKIWLDRTPFTFADALATPLNTALSDAVIHGFSLRWDLQDLVTLMGDRRLLRTDPANWMGRVVNAGPGYQYRWALGDITDRADAQDLEFARELMQ